MLSTYLFHMNALTKICFLSLTVLLTQKIAAPAQNSVSIGTTSLNANAVLWLNSPGKNQGLIVPIVSNKSSVTPAAGMIIFDESDKKMYYHNGTTWEALPGSGSGGPIYSAGTGISIVGAVISNSGDTNASDDVISTSISGGDLSGTFSNLQVNAGAIGNAEVSPTAAIAGTKINPNFGTQNIATTGSLTSGATTVSGLTVSGASTSLNAINYTWPNAQATGTRVLQNDGTGTLSWAPSPGLSSTLTSANMFVGNGSNLATGVAMSGDATLANTGAITIANNAITSAKISDGVIADADVSPTAAIAGTKISPNFGTQNISTNGNIGIGTPNPTTARLVISGGSSQTGLDLSTSDQYADMRVIRNSLSPVDNDMYIGYLSSPTSSLFLYSNNVNTMSVVGTRVGIGLPLNTLPAARLEVREANSVGAWIENASSGAATLYLRNTGPGYGIFSEATQNGGNSNWVNASDIRLKKNIEPLQNALQNVLKMRGVSFDWRQDIARKKNLSTKHEIGVIAQEIKEIYPEVVTTDPDGYLAVGYSTLVPVLIEAIKEQQLLIETLKSQTADLHKKLDELSTLKIEINNIKKILGLDTKANND